MFSDFLDGITKYLKAEVQKLKDGMKGVVDENK